MPPVVLDAFQGTPGAADYCTVKKGPASAFRERCGSHTSIGFLRDDVDIHRRGVAQEAVDGGHV